MTTESRTSDYDRQGDHAVLFRGVAERMTRAAVEFAAGIQPVLTVEDAVRLYWLAGCHLALAANSPADVAAMLRTLAAAIEAGAPVAN